MLHGQKIDPSKICQFRSVVENDVRLLFFRYFVIVIRLGANSRDFKSGIYKTTVTLAVHDCIRAHQVWSASCVLQHLDRYVTDVRLEITAIYA